MTGNLDPHSVNASAQQAASTSGGTVVSSGTPALHPSARTRPSRNRCAPSARAPYAAGRCLSTRSTAPASAPSCTVPDRARSARSGV